MYLSNVQHIPTNERNLFPMKNAETGALKAFQAGRTVPPISRSHRTNAAERAARKISKRYITSSSQRRV